MSERGKMLTVEHETKSAVSRVTMDNKRLTYKLQVLQQPLRARACGSGAKSSADRRPVDPPPIVELKIFEGEPNKEEDITFNMNANYFLFATLEPARQIAQGRVPEDKNRTCVLTGAPVAGMVYLDRPTPAGYFIFPDLSVRHEGKYRLSFSLYEELKNPRDFDKQEGHPPSSVNNGDAHVTHRLEVRSEPFVVFSAKKFPGLTESTSLSRVVAEQGCRVRIRRDVRMRKRDSKPGKDWDDYEDDTAAARARMSATPENTQYGPTGYSEAIARPRSASTASMHSIAANSIRRPSNSDLGSQYHPAQYNSLPRTPQSAFVPPSPFGPMPPQQYSQTGHFVTQHTTMQPPPPMFSQPQTHVQLQAHQHQHSQYTPSTVAPDATSSPTNYYSYSSGIDNSQQQPAQHHQQHFATQVPTCQDIQSSQVRLSTEYPCAAQRGSSHGSLQLSATPAPLPSLSQASQEPQGYGVVAPQHYQSHQMPALQVLTGGRPPQQSPVQELARVPQPTQRAIGRIDNQLPPLQLPESTSRVGEPTSPAAPSHMGQYHAQSESNHKRSFGNVFDDRHLGQPLRDGARPNIAYSVDPAMGSSAHDFAPDEPDSMAMRYRRADGSSIVRSLPPQN